MTPPSKICGGIGGGAVNAIEQAGIKLYAGASGEANRDHHDHEHGEGHSCAHGKCHE